MKNNNHNQDVQIQEIKTDVSWLKKELSEIKKQVFNDLPHQIESIKSRLFMGFTIGIASIIITQILLKLFNI